MVLYAERSNFGSGPGTTELFKFCHVGLISNNLQNSKPKIGRDGRTITISKVLNYCLIMHYNSGFD